MNEQDLLKGLNDIDDAFIDEAGNLNAKKLEKKPWIRWVSLAAALCLVVTMFWPFYNVTVNVSAQDLMEGITPQPVETIELESGTGAVLDFSVDLMKKGNEAGENTLISPVSALYALAMTANGAKGETLSELETVFGMSVDELNRWLYSYSATFGTKQLKIANSVWFANRESFRVNQDFLQTNGDYYRADIYKAAFDQSTVQDVNHWVNHHTDGMIPEILDMEDLDQALMVLINALCFDAGWEEPYLEDNVRPNLFTPENGESLTVDFLYSTEDLYLQDSMATGVIKPYALGRYAFLAMLPNEGITVEDYLNSLTKTRLENLLGSAEHTLVSTAIPKFETEFTLDMKAVLKEMGVTLAFDPDHADLSGLGSFDNENIYIGQAKQKTYLSLDEKGTKAAAATTVISVPTSAPVTDIKVVYLDRPFVYMLVDMQTGIPIFIGTMMNPGE